MSAGTQGATVDLPRQAGVRERLSYLREAPVRALDRLHDVTFTGPDLRAGVAVTGVGRRSTTALTNPQPGRSGWAPPLTALLSGLSPTTPVAFAMQSDAGHLSCELGVWATAVEPAGAPSGVERLEALKAALRASQPGVELGRASSTPRGWSTGGWVLGVPAAPEPSNADPRSGWDRVVGAMGAASWRCVVVAQPLPATLTGRLRDELLEEWRRTRVAADSSHLGNPLVDHYTDLLKQAVQAADEADLLGAWRTGVYLLADQPAYLQLDAVFRSVFGGHAPDRDPLRSAVDARAPELAQWWALPGDAGPAGPGAYRRPFSHQSVLTSRELASYVSLPEREHPGFSVLPPAVFSVTHPVTTRPGRLLDLGAVVDEGRPTTSRYRLDLDGLTRHTFVAGLTGAGKTNTVVHLLTECVKADVPFLVIEPAKAEYRALLNHPLLSDTLRVFTVGKEAVSPLRLNPFEVPVGVDVSEHVDLLKATFAGSFAMWVPLPQILEQALIQLYVDRGWDFASGQNARAVDGAAPASPTLSDLVAVVERIVPTLGYKGESTQEISAALVGRLKALTRGTRGLMLDVERSIPVEELLAGPTVVELEGLADDDDKAFVMGLILTRLYEHRRAENRRRSADHVPGTLRHLLVVEEAHRLLSRSDGAADSYHADPSGAFVDLFGQMLAEIRSYGQAMTIVDQVPVRLAPDVLKNTNLKICHRLVAKDDREAVAGAMAMSEEQSAYLTRLRPGRTAVFSEGDHTPVIVDIQKVKDQAGERVVTDEDVAAAMRPWRARPAVEACFRARPTCLVTCADPELCRQAAVLAGTTAGRLLGGRLLGSLVEHVDGFDATWTDVLALTAARLRPDQELAPAATAVAGHLLIGRLVRRADQGRWSSALLERCVALAADVVVERAAAAGRWLGATGARTDLVTLLLQVANRQHDPYPLCSVVCPDRTCRYRDTLSDVVLEPRHTRLWAEPADQDDPDRFVAERSIHAAEDVVSVADDAPHGRDALVAARFRATACAVQARVSDASDGHVDVRHTADVIGITGWALAVPADSTI